MGAKRKSYTPAYRREAARLVIDTGRRIVEVAGEIGVGEALLGRWVAIERAHMDGEPPQALDADERAELERLRREVAELRMDREFLKKAAASSRRRTTRTATGVRSDHPDGAPRITAMRSFYAAHPRGVSPGVTGVSEACCIAAGREAAGAIGRRFMTVGSQG